MNAKQKDIFSHLKQLDQVLGDLSFITQVIT